MPRRGEVEPCRGQLTGHTRPVGTEHPLGGVSSLLWAERQVLKQIRSSLAG